MIEKILLGSGRRFRVSNIIDDFTREMVGQLKAVSINGAMEARFLDQMIELSGKANSVVFDNRTDYSSKSMFS
ncbi:transposase [Glaciecola sp. KUL10]|nr:transposase [Glaciecola sp. KUL10]